MRTGSSSPGSSWQTRISVPRPSSDRLLTLQHGETHFSFFVRESIFAHISEIENSFTSDLRLYRAGSLSGQEPLSELELFSKFVDEVTSRAEIEEDEDRQLSFNKILECLLCELEEVFLRDADLHTVVATLPGSKDRKQAVLKSYYRSCQMIHRPLSQHETALFRDAAEGKAQLFAIFNGQGAESYFEELEETYDTYPGFLDDLLVPLSADLRSLSCDSRVNELYPKGLDFLGWLQNPESRPDLEYLLSAPVSLPLIGVGQLMRYSVICQTSGRTPGELRGLLGGSTGHSQGIVIAAAISMSDSWKSFEQASQGAVRTLFWIGCRTQQIFPHTSISAPVIQDSLQYEEGSPSPMLSVRGLPKAVMQKHIEEINHHLPSTKQIHFALINGPRQFVIAGPPMSLYGLNIKLRPYKANQDPKRNIARIPFGDRVMQFTSRFLPITVPFHSPYAGAAMDLIMEDLRDISLSGDALRIPVFDTHTGSDLRKASNLVREMVCLITRDAVYWQKATAFCQVTHILDFGPGGTTGLVSLTNQQKDGTGVRIVLATALEGTNPDLGYLPEITSPKGPVSYAVNWRNTYGPHLIQTSMAETFVDTKMSRFLGLPPIMVAGMTPCTVPWDFVAAITNSGYYVELACGGYHNAEDLEEAIHKLVAVLSPGRGIACNVIYANPRSIGWQIPLITKLCSEGLPITGLTIGAGVPSLETANSYIRDIGISHIAFKPGSVNAIQAVVEIAKANPRFPIMLQWTGGRGGGHHSFEDFHEPILEKYSQIRRMHNIILVAGSGFGGADDTIPYLNGSWSEKFGFPYMPFDGVLLGSRIMTAKEAHTSPAAKQAIVDAKGLDDNDWEQTYKGPAGGIITVTSEMGEPIHMLATRGVLFWAEMDKQIFALERSKRVPELLRQRNYIIQKLNTDFQKVWFGRSESGRPVDIGTMTYAECVWRMVDLMYVAKEERWIDVSYRNLTGDFIRRLEERLAPRNSNRRVAVLKSYDELDAPYVAVEDLLLSYPASRHQPVTAEDIQYFLVLCRRSGQKPVPFIPALDENFEYWFKKDSLWQSEDLVSVVDEDVGRTCILQGPVAARHSKVIDEPVKDILDKINNAYIEELLGKSHAGQPSNIPVVDYFGGTLGLPRSEFDIRGLQVQETEETVSYHLNESLGESDEDSWFSLLACPEHTWQHAIFTIDHIVQNRRLVPNPFKRIFAPARGIKVEVRHDNAAGKAIISLSEQRRDNTFSSPTAEVYSPSRHEILVMLWESRNSYNTACGLLLRFSFHPDTGSAPIREIMEDRNNGIKAFYRSLWNIDDTVTLSSISDTFDGGEMRICGLAVKNFVGAIHNRNEAYLDGLGTGASVPLDFAIVVAWKAIMAALFPNGIDGDLLKLVHLKNSIEMLGDAEPIRQGEILDSTAQIGSITIKRNSGKVVEVRGTISRDRRPIIALTSQFLFRGSYNDFETAFEQKSEPLMQLEIDSMRSKTILGSKDWFHLTGEGAKLDLLNKTLLFDLESLYSYSDYTQYDRVDTTGRVVLQSSKGAIEVATVNYSAGSSVKNAVTDFLQRHGSPVKQPFIFERPITLHAELRLQMPESNEPYSRASGDYNPIHVSRIFAQCAGHQQAITHGMCTSAMVRGLVESSISGTDSGSMRNWDCSFLGIVLPKDELLVTISHSGMIDGKKLVDVEATNARSGERVLQGRAEIEQPRTAYIFTGQGSQEPAMGMDLYATSPVARQVWDQADTHFLDSYGFAITDIIRKNPKELTIHFGGSRGVRVRHNYMQLLYEAVQQDGTMKSEKIFKDISETTPSYTFRGPRGLLHATQFTQPALALMELAHFKDMRAKHLIDEKATFAGHSLGEYSALAAIAEVIPVDTLASVVFYRGLTMQNAVEHDDAGRTNYSMCAIDPSRVSKGTDESDIDFVIKSVLAVRGGFLEIVNYNVADTQYLDSLDILTSVLNRLSAHKTSIKALTYPSATTLTDVITTSALLTQQKPHPLDLERGIATIPLRGIHIPFHSRLLRSGVDPFRNFLATHIPPEAVDADKLEDKYVPNLVAEPFQLSREYFEIVAAATGSSVIEGILDNWESYLEPGSDPASH
ncbi:MAG: hypothetical protein M1819_007261 [Sarea resinae]|nr:MAG: hypothetical protein M1819_007261 [Sarea resinae]